MSRARVIGLAVWVFVSSLAARAVISDEPVSSGLMGAGLAVVIAMALVWAIERGRNRIDAD
ncbi:MAG: hypothetical protein M3345_00975 [Actinomycetota bacterium]|nr:hypothetical protein [Actinomycetota bacterium]